MEEVLQSLKSGGSILYPTDTVWGIGCDATSEKAVSEIFKIKKRATSKSLIILVDSVEMLEEYVLEIPNNVFKVLKEATKPTTIIYNNPQKLASNVIASDGSVAIRIVEDAFCQQLIHKFEKPIVSTSANLSGDGTPKSFSEISNPILDTVDYIVNLRKEEIATASSRILRILEDGRLEIIRE